MRLAASWLAGLDAGRAVGRASMRWTHSVQLSTVPLPRGASGFWSSIGSWTKERALYGQAIMQ